MPDDLWNSPRLACGHGNRFYSIVDGLIAKFAKSARLSAPDLHRRFNDRRHRLLTSLQQRIRPVSVNLLLLQLRVFLGGRGADKGAAHAQDFKIDSLETADRMTPRGDDGGEASGAGPAA
jgi:hypothetical protein